jgi:TRAP-type C4-dicarboxylate transport system permease large subunit
MMELFLWWVLPALYTIVLMGLVAWWSVRHTTSPRDEYVSLYDIIVGVIIALVPVVNIAAGIILTGIFVYWMAPEIIVVGEKE